MIDGNNQRVLFKKVDYDVAGLLHYIENGDIGLPDLQRPFVWTATKVRDLLDSMYRGFPVGYLLLWATSADGNGRHIGVGAAHVHTPSLLIIDGQQRLTSLYAVFRGKKVINAEYQPVRIEIAFCPRDGKFEVADASHRRDPEYVPDISELFASGKTGFILIGQFFAGLKARRPVGSDDEELMSRNFERLFALTQYPFTALEIFSTVDEESVASVFVRINSAGVKLNQADFILTLMSVFWDEGRTELETFCRSARRPSTGAPSPYNHFIQPDPDQLLRVSVALAFRRARLEYVYSILRGKDLETRSFSAERRDEQFATLAKAQSYVLHLTHWQEFTQVLRHAGFRSKSMISSEMVFLYSYALFLIGRRDFKVSAHKLRSVIARWFFFAALTSRYSASPETVMEQDLARLRAVHKDDADGFIAVLDNVISETLTNDFWAVNVPNDLASSSARSPALFAYHAALMLLDAKALFSKLSIADLFDPTIVALKPPLDRHHLFPRNYLKGIGVTDIRERNRIANYALVEWSDDIAISDTSPCDYFPKFVTARHITGAELVKTSYWHALPDGWENMTYANFLVERQKLIARVIQDGYATLRDSTLHGEG